MAVVLKTTLSVELVIVHPIYTPRARLKTNKTGQTPSTDFYYRLFGIPVTYIPDRIFINVLFVWRLAPGGRSSAKNLVRDLPYIQKLLICIAVVLMHHETASAKKFGEKH
jgi:hypothetical protein